MKILITGVSGQLGQHLILKKPSKINSEEINIIGTSKKELDLSKESECRELIFKINPDWVINCGAYTSVDKAESEKEIANLINGKGPYFLAKSLSEIGGKLLHISTDFVFDGKNNEAYEIDHPLNPINVYGESKALAEKLLISENNFGNIYVLRTSWVLSNLGKNFFLTILNLLSKKDLIHVVNDQIGCITSAGNLAELCWKIIKTEKEGVVIPKILHFSDSGICNWFDVASAIYEFSEKRNIITKKTEIIPVKSDFFNLPAKRPKFSLLNSQHTYNLFNFYPTHWRNSLESLLDSLDEEFLKNFTHI